jgi:hypothetical protein
MKIRPVGVKLPRGRTDGRTDGETDMTKLISAFRNFPIEHKNYTNYRSSKSSTYKVRSKYLYYSYEPYFLCKLYVWQFSMVEMVHWRSFLFCHSNFRTPMKSYRVCGRHSSKTENRLCNAVKLVPTSKKTTSSRVYRKNSVTYCRRTKQNPQGHLKRKILSRQMAKYALKRKKLPAWRYATKSHIFSDITEILSPAKLRFDYTHDKDVGEVADAARR